MLLGIGTYAYAWSIGIPGSRPNDPMTAPKLLHTAYELGVECVQFADNLPLHELPDESRAELRELATGLGLKIEVGARGLTENHLGTYLEMATEFDSPILRFVIDSLGYEPELPEVIQLIRDYLPELKSRNVKLAIENHDRLKAREFLRIVEETDPEWVGICLDPVNSLGADEGFAEVSRILLPHTVNLHIKDYLIRRPAHNMGFQVRGTVAGEGMLPITHLLKQVISIGKCHSAILESWPPPESRLAETVKKEQRWAQSGTQYLKNIFQSMRHGQA